jgi:hypothetical protein
MQAWRKGLLPAAAIGICISAPLAAQEDATLRRFTVPGHGSLQLNVPKTWRIADKSLEDPASVTLRFLPGSGEAFHVQVTSLWLDAGKRAGKTPEQLRKDVQQAGEKSLGQALEKQLTLHPLRGAKAQGYYYTLTDRDPAPGEYKHLTQGMFLAGELFTIFTFLHHEPEIAAKAQALQMFAAAAHVASAPAAKSEGGHFSFDMGEPRLRLVVPDIPPMAMGPHPNAPAQPHARFMGSGERGYSVSVLTPTADPGMTPKDCAGSIYRSLVSRYGLQRESVTTHKSNDSTFIMLFPVRTGPLTQFKAYLLSGYGGHCLEVHISRTVTAQSQEALSQELAEWYRGFRQARIEPY